MDIGLDYRPLTALSLTVRGFANIVDDAIVENVVSENPSQAQSVNAGKTKAYGLELSLNHKLNRIFEWYANYTFTSTDIENELDRDQDGAEIPFVPQNVGNVGLTVNWPLDFRMTAYLHVHGRIYDSTSKTNRRQFDSYEVLNFSIQKPLFKSRANRIDVYLKLYNITNNRYEMPWQFQDTGFAMTTGLALAF
jgi:outer membrane receptor protein involved in Fe transport